MTIRFDQFIKQFDIFSLVYLFMLISKSLLNISFSLLYFLIPILAILIILMILIILPKSFKKILRIIAKFPNAIKNFIRLLGNKSQFIIYYFFIIVLFIFLTYIQSIIINNFLFYILFTTLVAFSFLLKFIFIKNISSSYNLIVFFLVLFLVFKINEIPKDTYDLTKQNPSIVPERIFAYGQRLDFLEKHSCIYTSINYQTCVYLKKHPIKIEQMEIVINRLYSNTKNELFEVGFLIYIKFPKEFNIKILRGFFGDEFIKNNKFITNDKIDETNKYRIDLTSQKRIIFPFVKNIQNDINQFGWSLFKKFNYNIKPYSQITILKKGNYSLRANLCWKGCPKINILLRDMPKNSIFEINFSTINTEISEGRENIRWEIPSREKMEIENISFLYFSDFVLSIENGLKVINKDFSLGNFIGFSIFSILSFAFAYILLLVISNFETLKKILKI